MYLTDINKNLVCCSKKSKKKLSDKFDELKSSSPPPPLEAEPVIVDEVNSVKTPNDVVEQDDWSDTPLSALKEETIQEVKSNIDATIQAVLEADSNQEPSVTGDESNAPEDAELPAVASVKTEKSSDVPEDDSSPFVKSAQSTPQSNKTKRRTKSSRSRSSK